MQSKQIAVWLAAFGLALLLIGGAGYGEEANTETLRQAAARQETGQVQKRSSETEREGGGKLEEENSGIPAAWQLRYSLPGAYRTASGDINDPAARLSSLSASMGEKPNDSLFYWLVYRDSAGYRNGLSRGLPAGIFKVTAYTNGPEDTDKYPDDEDYGITATGTYTTAYKTVAADWDILPPGSIIYIDRVGIFIVEDKGAAVRGQHIDRFVDSTGEALAWGVRYRLVYIIKKGVR